MASTEGMLSCLHIALKASDQQILHEVRTMTK